MPDVSKGMHENMDSNSFHCLAALSSSGYRAAPDETETQMNEHWSQDLHTRNPDDTSGLVTTALGTRTPPDLLNIHRHPQ